ncbi:MAG TPA: monovalent cation/H+ antiporter complex subunit F [Longimicrobiales bacterium]|nr:monovalent cation/H+ antiporter complex subunit F [Longimicrobiales bacterium]
MTTALTLLAGFIALLLVMNFAVVMKGPTVYDRLLGIGAMGTNTVLLIAVIGFWYGGVAGFLDLAITYAILNFVGVVAVAKYVSVTSRRAAREVDQ